MGTRADFYVGRGEDMRWIGSVAWDAFPWVIAEHGFLQAATEDEFVAGVTGMAETRSDFTSPEMGWPWPWADSSTTDFAYAFDDGRVFVSRQTDEHSDWIEAAPFASGCLEREDMNTLPSCGPLSYPNMAHIQNVDFGSRSGLIVLGS